MAQNPQRRQAPPLHIRARNTIGNWVGGFLALCLVIFIGWVIFEAGRQSSSPAPKPPVAEEKKEKAKEPSPIPEKEKDTAKKPAPAPKPESEKEAPATPPTPPVGPIPGWRATYEIPAQEQSCVGKTAGYVFACRESRSGWCICQ